MTTTKSEPRVVIHQTKTAGHQVIYVAASGRRYIRARHLGYLEARQIAETLGRLHSCIVVEAES